MLDEQPADLLEDLLADVDDQTGLLGDAEEVTGEEQTADRVLPSHEGLVAGDRAVGEPHDRLVVDDELVPAGARPRG